VAAIVVCVPASVESHRRLLMAESDALAARLARADAARPGVEQGDQPEVLALLVERPVLLLVRRERL